MSPARIKNVPIISTTSDRKRQSAAPPPQQQQQVIQDNGQSKKKTAASDSQENGSSANPSSVTALKTVTVADADAAEDHSSDDSGVVQKSNLLLQLSDKPSIYLSILLGLQVTCRSLCPI
jgi:hypothetical protein